MITHVSPLGSMDMLSQLEVDMLKRTASSDLYQLFRNCSLAVLNSGSLTDNSKELLSRFENFDINVLRRERGVKLELINPPEEAFVDGRIIRSLQANLFAVLRDILFVYGQIHNTVRFPNLDLESSVHITNLVFSILRNARALHVGEAPNMIVCWGGRLDQRERVPLRPPCRYAAGSAGTEHLHRLRAWRDGSADERRRRWPCAAALQRQPLYRHDRAVHYRRGTAKPAGQ